MVFGLVAEVTADQSNAALSTVTVIVSPVPLVEAPTPPNTFKLLSAGTAIPLSVVYWVATAGGEGPADVLFIDTCEITHPP